MLQDATAALSLTALATVALPVGLVMVLVVCLQCFKKRTSGFSNFDNNRAGAANTNQGHDNNTFAVDISDTDVDSPSSTAVTIEPLPDITPKAKQPSVPLRPRMGCLDKTRQDASLKLIAVHHPFPRNQIMYLKELGAGWFGKVIESDAEKITTGVPRSKVVVKMLKDDATKEEQLLFFEEVAAFRELEHPNVLHLLGQCTEMHPMLMILEAAAFGNLKHYLRTHRQSALVQKNKLMQFAIDACTGVACLHRHDYLHKDLASRNCLVMSNYAVKIGDYGIAEDLFKEDYYTSGEHLLPIRWMAPETLRQENGTWIADSFSKESDIWSLGVLLWEIVMMGERPYDMLTSEAVLQGVITDQDIKLPQPGGGMPNADRLFEVMRFCWMEPSQRIKVDEVCGLLKQISSKAPTEGASEGIEAFDKKWEHLMPNQRRTSVDSLDDRRDSMTSADYDLLAEISKPDSLEDLTAPQAPAVAAPPQAPPRSPRKKLSASTISIPKAEEEEAKAATPGKKVEKAAKPQPEAKVAAAEGAGTVVAKPAETPAPEIVISAAGETAPAAPAKTATPTKPVPAPRQKGEIAEPEEAIPPRNASETEFTEFASHEETAQKPSVSVPEAEFDLFTSSTGPSPPPPVQKEKEEPLLQVGAGDSTNPPAKVEEDISVISSPPRSQPQAMKTSTPIAITKDQDPVSPSSSEFSIGDSSSASFLTARTSSPGNFADAYATANDSTFISNAGGKLGFEQSLDFSGAFDQQPSTMGDSNMSFEIIETTAVQPPIFGDFEKSVDESGSSVVSSPFMTPPAKSNGHDDLFGEFTDASGEDGSGGVSPAPEADAFSQQPDTPMAQADFSSFDEFTSFTASETHSDEMTPPSSGFETGSTVESTKNITSSPETNPFVSFGTDLSSMSSLANASAEAKAVAKEPDFPSLASDLPSLSSLDTATFQADPQTNPFAFGEPSKPADASSSSAQPLQAPSALDDFSFDTLSSQAPDLGFEEAAPEVEETPKVPAPDADPFAALNLGGPAVDSGEKQSTTQDQSLDDLFGLAGESPSSPGEASGSGAATEGQGSTETSEVTTPSSSSAAYSDFDLLSGFSSAPTPSATNPPPSDLFGGDDDNGGFQLSAAAPSALKVGNGVESGGATSLSSESESSSNGTDTDSTSNSDSSKEYTCEEAWAEAVGAGGADALASSPASSVDSEEMALQIASEIYLSRGLKMARPYETPFLEPIPEDPLPSISEESGAPTPSETSSVDLRMEDVFEWDDFMGEPLVGKERTSPEMGSPRRSFDMPDWTLDVDSESLRSGSSPRSRRSSDDLSARGSVGSESVVPPGLAGSSCARPSSSPAVPESEVTATPAHEPPRTHRSYISDLLANRTKGLTALNSTTTPSSSFSLSSSPLARTQKNPTQFYSLYEDDFDLDSSSSDAQSDSEGSCSPPVPNPAPESRDPPSQGRGVSTLHAEPQPPHSSSPESGEESATTYCIQDPRDVLLVANGSGGPDKSPISSLLDFTSLDPMVSAPAAAPPSATTGEGTNAQNPSPLSSLIDF